MIKEKSTSNLCELCSRNSRPSKCPQCSSSKLFKGRKGHINDGDTIQLWLCAECGHRFSYPRAKPRARTYNSCQDFLEKELCRLQRRTRMGYEVKVVWLPGLFAHHDRRKLAEEVKNDTIFVYVENPIEATKLLRHGFLEWLMNRHTKPYRQFINKLIALFENLQYENKEEILRSLEKLL